MSETTTFETTAFNQWMKFVLPIVKERVEEEELKRAAANPPLVQGYLFDVWA